ncbi:NAD-dependent epimerase/dehydratase family protein [Vallitalea pronyensis]|uniref:NAD-dependent epimerase/dehydratase family protein n=1 Tax=Vallitalea pronyensis TaxID=1348613 RepID=A0A8J8SG30_9FIRM|nr:NAD-dependent epimerase/dehydratase family protein [Vallitalea pronyensis]QUI21957.1 NAD-dependent epimerase/dehydratase family protein [Vallitalea pronyensis]
MGYNTINFPEGTTFLVTGAAGFIGSNLVETILKLGYQVRGLDNYATGKKQHVAAFMDHPNYDFIEGDIRDYEVCLQASSGVDYILHQAALGSVPRSMKEPLIYESNNIQGTSHMMEAARRAGVKRFVYASSSSVYGDSSTLPKKEGQEGDVLSPYALTKKVNEQYGKLYTEVYGLGCIGLRYFNVYGRRQDPDSQYAAVIPKFVKALYSGEQVDIHGDGEQSRDFTYIDNVIEANLKSCLASQEACGKSYNIAYGQCCTINQMYKLMCKQLGILSSPQYVEEREGDIKYSLADISEASKCIGYHPDWNFTKGFVEAVNWYRDNI